MKKYPLYYKIIFLFLIVEMFFPSLAFCQIEPKAFSNSISKNLQLLTEKIKEIGDKILKACQRGAQLIWEKLEKFWQEKIIPFWQKIWLWFKENILYKIKPSLKEEVEKRGPLIEKEFQKEKEEIKKEIPEAGKSLWEKLRELIKK